jgi:hypothetical protein
MQKDFMPLMAVDDGTQVASAPAQDAAAAQQPAAATPDSAAARPTTIREAAQQLAQLSQQIGDSGDTAGSTQFQGGAGEQALQEAISDAQAQGVPDDQIAQAQQDAQNGQTADEQQNPEGAAPAQQATQSQESASPIAGSDGLIDGQQNPAAQDAEVIAAQQARQNPEATIQDLSSLLAGLLPDDDDDGEVAAIDVQPDVQPDDSSDTDSDDAGQQIDPDAALAQFQEDPVGFLQQHDESVRQQAVQDVLNSPEIQAAIGMAQESQKVKGARKNLVQYVKSVAGDDAAAQNAFAARYGTGIQQNWDAANSVPDAQKPLMIAHQAAIISELQSHPSLAALSADPSNWDKVAGNEGLMNAMLQNPAIVQAIAGNDGIKKQIIGNYAQELQDGAKPAVLNSSDSSSQIQASAPNEPRTFADAKRGLHQMLSRSGTSR